MKITNFDKREESLTNTPGEGTTSAEESDELTPELVREYFERAVAANAGANDSTDASETELVPYTPENALEKYLESRRGEASDQTITSHESRIGHIVAWCEGEDLDDISKLNGDLLASYENWRFDGSLATTTEKSEKDSLRVFLRYCEKIDAIPDGFSEKVVSPTLKKGEDSRDVMVTDEQANEILDYLRKYEYASLVHVVWLLLTQTGIRTGGARALDLEDYHSDADGSYLAVRHRPDTETPLKNGEEGERLVSIEKKVCAVVDDYVNDVRPDVTDDFGREPLLATSHGRVDSSTVRKYVYKWTRPCEITGECPHAQEVDDCDAASNCDTASQCQSSRSPHAIRRGYITNNLDQGVPKFALSERCNVTEDNIDDYYDERDEEEKLRLRRQLFDSREAGGDPAALDRLGGGAE